MTLLAEHGHRSGAAFQAAPGRRPALPVPLELVPLRPVHALELYRLVLDDDVPDGELLTTQRFARTRRDVLRRTMSRDPGRNRSYAVLVGCRVTGLATLADIAHGDACRADVSVAIDLRMRGHGLATRALGEVAARAADLGLRRLEAAVLPDNTAARRLLARAGFLPVGLARGYRLVDGRWRDHVLYERVLPAAEPHENRRAS